MTDSTTIVLAPEVAELVRDVVLRGRHANASDAIRAALEEYVARDEDRFGLSSDEIRRLWDEGVASGPGREADFAAIRRDVRRRGEAGRTGR